MTGSLQTKNDKYYVVINFYEYGKRKQKWVSTDLPVKNNKKKAEQALREILFRFESEALCPHTDILFSSYIKNWLEYKKESVDEVTYQGYELLAESHIIPYFEEHQIKLQKLDVEDLQKYFDYKKKYGRLDGNGGLSARSLRLHRNIIHQTLNLAIKNKVIQNNPCEFVDLPKNERFNSSFYTVNQIHTLFKAAANDELFPLIKITALYGLRRSEVLGIKWDSIDFVNKLLTIKHTVASVVTVVEKDKTKTASSYRSFPLTEDALSIFQQLKEHEEDNRRLFGGEYIENDYVFKWPNGSKYSPNYVSRHFSKLLEDNNLPHIRFHELRHSCASIFLNSGRSLKEVQEYLGHSTIAITANIYGHLDVSIKKSMSEALSGSLFGT